MQSPNDHIVSKLVRETGRPEMEVRRIYEDQLASLHRSAKIKTFVAVIAARHAREILTRH